MLELLMKGDGLPRLLLLAEKTVSLGGSRLPQL